MSPVETNEMIESQPSGAEWDESRGIAPFQVPFADIAGLVSICFQDFRQKILPKRDGVMVGVHPRAVVVFSGEQRRPEGRAQGKGSIRLIKTHAFFG